MKFALFLACLGLTACSGAKNEAAQAAEASRVDPVTAKAITDTQAAEADALKAADAALDNLDNTIDDKAGAKAPAGKKDTGVSKTTKVVVY